MGLRKSARPVAESARRTRIRWLGGSIRIGDLYQWDDAKKRILDLLAYHNFLLEQYYHVDPVDPEAELELGSSICGGYQTAREGHIGVSAVAP